MTSQQIAAVCHEAMRAYGVAIGDHSITYWEDAPDWQRISAVRGVEGVLDGTISGPESAHEAWLRDKAEDGWTWGPVKDASKFEHPAYLPYGELPEAQKRKDALFFAIVQALRD